MLLRLLSKKNYAGERNPRLTARSPYRDSSGSQSGYLCLDGKFSVSRNVAVHQLILLVQSNRLLSLLFSVSADHILNREPQHLVFLIYVVLSY